MFLDISRPRIFKLAFELEDTSSLNKSGCCLQVLLFSETSYNTRVRRKTMQILQLLPEWSRKLWSEWHARVLVLLSLTLQIVLVFLGSRRKRSGKLWIRIVVWSAYLAADSVAMLAIGVISSNLEDIYDKSGKIDENVELVTFWAPFLLLHLGGPDTITAYALEDNELWLRHLLGVVAQTGLTVYLLLMAWTGSHLSILAIFVTVAGMVKYCERTWVLWRASGENSMGFTPEFTEFITKNDGNNVVVISEENVFHLAYMLMKNFMIVTADYPRLLDQSFKVLVGKLLDDSSPKMCFKLIEVELGFLYDMLYTKAKLVHTGWGIGLRLVSFSVTSLVLVFFALAAAHKHAYSKIDLAITFVLLVGAIILEVYASGSAVISSDWTRAWTQSTQTCGPAVGSFQKPCLNVIGDSRWKESISQFSILGFPFREKHVLCKGKAIFDSYFPEVYQNLEHRKSITYTEVTDILKERIVIQVRNEKPQLHERSLNREMRAYRKYDLQSIIPYAGGKLKGLRENIMKWHIATEICYHLEDVDCINSANVEAEYKMSLQISQYLMSIVIMYPLMLPGDERKEIVQGVCDNAMDLYEQMGKQTDKVQFYRALQSQSANQEDVDEALDRGVFLSKKIESILDMEKKWGFISEVWLYLLISAAAGSSGKQHAHQLRRGGELLSHVWLLVAHVDRTS